MEKRKEKADLEQLLNSLIKRWRVPFGDEKIHSFEIIYVTWKIRNIIAKRWRWQVNMHYSIRDLVSKSSGLWQFVCENKLLAKWILDLPDVLWKRDSLACMRTDLRKSCYPHDYEYRLIESALCDEDKLEDFLLSNIKVEWK